MLREHLGGHSPGGDTMKQIRIPLRGVRKREEETLMRQLTGIVSVVEGGAPWRQVVANHNGWVLDVGNDWFANITDGVLEVRYRYGGSRNDEMMDALEVFLTWRYGKLTPARKPKGD